MIPRVATMGKIRKKWSDAELEAALAAVRSGRSANSVSKEMGIPRTTLACKVSGKLSVGKSVGPPPVLSSSEEAILVQWILHLNKRGFPVTKTQLIRDVAHLVKKLKRDNPFHDGQPGRHWYQGFLRRHPEIIHCIGKNMPQCQAWVSEVALRSWFREMKKLLDSKGLADVDGSRKFHCEEMAFFLHPKGERVLVRSGDKTAHNFVQSDEKECLSMFFVTTASGLMVPPMVVFQYERIPQNIVKSVPADWSIGKSESGWMTGDTFFQYIGYVFEPWLTANNIQRPVVLYVDGQSSNLTLPVTELCKNNGIELIALYPNMAYPIQILDVTLFRPLKAAWKDCIDKWRLENKKKMRRDDFAPLLKKVTDSLDLKEIIVNGFRTSGLHPFSVEALQYQEPPQKKKDGSLILAIDATSEKDKAKNVLALCEKHVDEEVLEEFKAAEKTGMWNGGVENTGLFFFWLRMLKLSNEEDLDNDSHMEEPDIPIGSESDNGMLIETVIPPKMNVDKKTAGNQDFTRETPAFIFQDMADCKFVKMPLDDSENEERITGSPNPNLGNVEIALSAP